MYYNMLFMFVLFWNNGETESRNLNNDDQLAMGTIQRSILTKMTLKSTEWIPDRFSARCLTLLDELQDEFMVK